MLTILFLLIWRSVATIHGYVKAYAPSNIAIAYLRGPGGLKWAIPAALVAVPAYLYVASLMSTLVNHGMTEWVYGAVFIAYVDACKFAALVVVAPPRQLAHVARRRRGHLVATSWGWRPIGSEPPGADGAPRPQVWK